MRRTAYYLSFIFFVLFLSGCVAQKPIPSVKGHEKVFENEDIYILLALHLEQSHNFKEAAVVFADLYKETSKKEYIYRSLKNEIISNQNKKAIETIDALSADHKGDFELMRIKVMALMRGEEFLEAKEVALKLSKQTNSVDDYLLVAETYIKLQEFEDGIRYLEGAYIKEYNEKILEKISIILYVNLQRKKDAIAQLETHSRVYGCSELICNRLISFYSNDNNIDALLATYLRLYSLEPKEEIAQKIIQIYGYTKNYTKLREFLEKNRIDDELLLQLYVQEKEYKKASQVAYEIYKETKDIDFLGQNAIFEYESTINKDDTAMHKSVVEKLTKVLKTSRKGMYLNYLGYLLIDHDIDVKKGIEYVKEALLQEPKSIYYLDSLAWGYYKLHKCEEAQKIIDRIVELDGSNNEEVLHHIEKIKECVKKQKVKK